MKLFCFVAEFAFNFFNGQMLRFRHGGSDENQGANAQRAENEEGVGNAYNAEQYRENQSYDKIRAP